MTAAAGYLLPAEKTDTPVRSVLSRNSGPVVFEHAGHEQAGIACERCHHDLVSGVSVPARCASCHGVVEAPTFKKEHSGRFSRESCSVCHHYAGSRRDWGHDRHVKEYGLECTACHHAEPEIEEIPMNCAKCHEGGAPEGKRRAPGGEHRLADAVHGKCADCHQEWFDAGVRGCAKCHDDRSLKTEKKRLHDGAAFSGCSSCHRKNVGKLVPGTMVAFHTMCMECHRKEGKGPQGKDQCGRCHLK